MAVNRLSIQPEEMEDDQEENQSNWNYCLCLGTFTGPDKRVFYALSCLSSGVHGDNSLCKECAALCYTRAYKESSSGNGLSRISCPYRCEHAVVFLKLGRQRRQRRIPVCR